jgi:hypothetical protein
MHSFSKRSRLHEFMAYLDYCCLLLTPRCIRRFDISPSTSSSGGRGDDGSDGKDASSISQVNVTGNGAVIGIDWCASSPHLLSILYRSSPSSSSIALWDGSSSTLEMVPKLSSARTLLTLYQPTNLDSTPLLPLY